MTNEFRKSFKLTLILLPIITVVDGMLAILGYGILGVLITLLYMLLVIRTYTQWIELKLRTMENIDDIVDLLNEMRDMHGEKLKDKE